MLRLFIENIELDVDFDEDVVTTHALNKIGDITSREGIYSNVFKLPKTERNMRELKMAGIVNGAGRLQYKRSSMRMSTEGLVIVGFGTISSIDSKINVRFMGSNYDWGDLIGERNLNDFDYPEADHEWTFNNVVDSRITDSLPYSYINADFGNGNIAGPEMNFMYLRPFYKVKYIFDKIFSAIGYSLKYSDSIQEKIFGLYESMVLCKEDYELKYIDEIEFTARLNAPQQIPTTNPIDAEVYRLDLVSDHINFDNSIHSFVVPVRGEYDLRFFATYLEPYTIPDNVTIGLLINGVPPAGLPFYGSQEGQNITLAIDNIELLEGWEVSIFGFAINPPLAFETFVNASMSVRLANQEQRPGIGITAKWMMPNMKAKDLIKCLSNQFGLIFVQDYENREVKISHFDEVLERIPNANDLSDKMVEGGSEITYSLGYARNNYFEYSSDEKDVLLSGDKTYAKYNLVVNDESLENERVVYTSPFAPVIRHGCFLDTGGNLQDAAVVPYMDMSKVDEWDVTKNYNEGESVKYLGYPYTSIAPSVGNTPGIDPQWIISYSGVAQEIKPRIAYVKRDNSCQFIIDGMPMTPTYLENQPQLYFTELEWSNLVNENYELVKTVLNDTVVVKTEFNLRGVDVENLDLLNPVYVGKHNAYFYIDSINQFNHTKRRTTSMTLVKILP